jgi:hypothetical protein
VMLPSWWCFQMPSASHVAELGFQSGGTWQFARLSDSV